MNSQTQFFYIGDGEVEKKDEDMDELTKQLEKLHISKEKAIRCYVSYLKHYHYVKAYRKRNRDKLNQSAKERRERAKRHEQNNPEVKQAKLKKGRDAYYKRRYGMTEDEYKGMKRKRDTYSLKLYA